MRIAVYVRVSTQNQSQAQTIEQQLERLHVHCQQQGWEWPEHAVFRDEGYSGASLKRPGLDRLRDQVSQASFDVVLLTEPDRLARKYIHQVLLLEEFEKGGCQVIFADRPMSQDPHDQLLLQIRGVVAEYERNLITERMRRGRLQKYRAGTLLPWSRPPFGYGVDPAHPRDPVGVRLADPAAAFVAEMFAYYQEPGHTLRGLAKHLIALGVRSPRGSAHWSDGTIRGILTNPVYTGIVYAGRNHYRPAKRRVSPLKPVGGGNGSIDRLPAEDWIMVAHIPPIVSQEQFDVIQRKLKQNQSVALRNTHAGHYLVRALVSCGACHLACQARSTDKGYAYYVCSGKKPLFQSPRQEKCHSRFIPVGQLDELVWRDLCELLNHPEHLYQALTRAQAGAWLPQEVQARRENLRKAQGGLGQQLERLTEAYLAAIVPLEEYQRRRRDLEQKQAALASQMRQLEASARKHVELAGVAQSMEAFCQRVCQGLSQASFEQKRRLVELLIDRVIVTGEEVEIRYVIPTTQNSEGVRFCHLRADYFHPKRVVMKRRVAHRFSTGMVYYRKLKRSIDFAQRIPIARLEERQNERGVLRLWSSQSNQQGQEPVFAIQGRPLILTAWRGWM